MSKPKSSAKRAKMILSDIEAKKAAYNAFAAAYDTKPVTPASSSKTLASPAAGSAIPAAKTTERQHPKSQEEKAEKPATIGHQSTHTAMNQLVESEHSQQTNVANTESSAKKETDSLVTYRRTRNTARSGNTSSTTNGSIRIDYSQTNTKTDIEKQNNWTICQLNSLISEKSKSTEPYMSSPFQPDSKLQIISAATDETFTKCYYLLQLRNTVNDPSWKKEGTGCFFRSITPRHIEKLQNILDSDLQTVINAYQSDDKNQFQNAVDNLFKKIKNIITQAQEKKPLFNFRSKKVSAFYEDTETAINQINARNFTVKQFPVSEIKSQPPRLSP